MIGQVRGYHKRQSWNLHLCTRQGVPGNEFPSSGNWLPGAGRKTCIGKEENLTASIYWVLHVPSSVCHMCYLIKPFNNPVMTMPLLAWPP